MLFRHQVLPHNCPRTLSDLGDNGNPALYSGTTPLVKSIYSNVICRVDHAYMMAYSLLTLPWEVLHTILLNVTPRDLAALRCCRVLDKFIEEDALLFKEIYLRHFDVRDDCGSRDWRRELKRLVRFEKILVSEDYNVKLAELNEVADCVQDLLKTAAIDHSSRNIAFLDSLISNQNTLQLLCNSSLFRWASTTTQPSQCSNNHPPPYVHSQQIHPSHQPLETTPPSSNSETTDFNHVYLQSGQIPKSGYVEPPPEPQILQSQLSAKLHCLYGVPIQHLPRSSSASHRHDLRANRGIKIHPFARSKVYDLRQHSEATLWGPFRADGSHNVDWEKVEAVFMILAHNVQLFADKYVEHSSILLPPWTEPFTGVTPHSWARASKSSDIERPLPLPLHLQDPYNLTGVWMRIVCFLDYRELFTFNFSEDQPLPGQPRPPVDTEEAIRFITVKIHVTKIEPPGEDDGQDLPIVHFKGTSISALPPVDPNANSKIRGTVRLTPEGEVRWTTFSVFHGEERWRSEGIQLGGVQAARGILGYWFDKDFDEYGPAGPTAFWKVSDDPSADVTSDL
ncbi:MAG: hypothetical protein Q9220_000585 [cf. Caloplaca sp. 1 TL-2023]